jgi:hypothetical protein
MSGDVGRRTLNTPRCSRRSESTWHRARVRRGSGAGIDSADRWVVGFVVIHAGPGLEGLCSTIYEQPPETLGQDRGFVGIRTALHADRAVAIEDMDRQGFGVFGGDEHATQRASFPELATVESGARRRQRSVIVTNN